MISSRTAVFFINPDAISGYTTQHMDFDSIKPILWENNHLRLLDQRDLPLQEHYIDCYNAVETARAIRNMVVRGAPAIGITAAYGIVLAAMQRFSESANHWKRDIEQDLQVLSESRPTAVNLFWAIREMRAAIEHAPADNPVPVLLALARQMHEQDIQANHRMGEYGAELIQGKTAVLTHCNTGSLATGGYGTALGVIRSAYAQGKIENVYADETRPWWQGARLTAWELVHDGIPVSLIVDSAAAYLMKQGKISWVIVGADRITANGDVANKIGTYSTAVLARHHGVKFMVAAPCSTIDLSLDSGDQIPIETRGAEEIMQCASIRIAAEGANAWNPVFDVTPAELIDAIVTERGVVLLPDRSRIARLFASET